MAVGDHEGYLGRLMRYHLHCLVLLWAILLCYTRFPVTRVLNIVYIHLKAAAGSIACSRTGWPNVTDVKNIIISGSVISETRIIPIFQSRGRSCTVWMTFHYFFPHECLLGVTSHFKSYETSSVRAQ